MTSLIAPRASGPRPVVASVRIRKYRPLCRALISVFADLKDTGKSIGLVWCSSRNCRRHTEPQRWSAITRHHTMSVLAEWLRKAGGRGRMQMSKVLTWQA